LSLEELKREIDERYAQFVGGIEVTPVLSNRAPRYVYVVGEVRQPGRYELQAPTTVMQSIALAGGWNNGGNLREIVVFRRDENWQLMATKLDVRGALLGKRPCPADEIWLRDSDLIVVPKSALMLTNDFIELVFTRGIYGVVPFNASYTYSQTKLIP
jgi:polysaccharide export outer membrane protein